MQEGRDRIKTGEREGERARFLSVVNRRNAAGRFISPERQTDTGLQ